MKGISGDEIIRSRLTGAFGKSWNAAGVALLVIVFLAGCTASPAQLKRGSTYETLYSKNAYNKKTYKKGIALGIRATGHNPTNGSAWYWLGANYDENKQYDEAIEAFKKVVKLNQVKIQVKSSYYKLGYIYHVKGDYKQATRYYSKRLEMDQKGSTYGYSLLFRSDTYLYTGMYDKALQDASNAMKYLNPDNEKLLVAGLYVTRAFSHLGLGETDMALSMINKVRQVNPDYNPENHLELIYFATGNEQKLKGLLKGKGWLGIETKNYAKGTVKAIQVVSVVRATSAEKGGLLKGDLIMRMNGVPSQDLKAFLQKLGATAPGSIIQLNILRGKEEKKIDISLGSRNDTSIMESNRLIASLLTKKKMLKPAEEAEKSGHYRKAFLLYRKASRPDSDIIGRIISLYHKLDPAPVIPEEARKHAVFAATATKVAKDNSGYDQAIKEYYAVMHQAPWWADPYFNLALVLEKRGRFSEAVKVLRLYLLASPNAPDANTIQAKIYELEFKAKIAKS